MKFWLNVYRQKDGTAPGRFQEYTIVTDDEKMTVAKALKTINEAHPEDPVRWENSCLQKKCGACAMVINGTPALACERVLKETAKKGRITIEPLRKFPVVADLIVDRGVLFDHLKTMEMWAQEDIEMSEDETEISYEASRCLQCGCCLEVCPNFYAEGCFFGMAAMAPATRLIAAESEQTSGELRKAYRKHVYDGCGKSLACQNVCPAKLDVEHLMSRSNGAAVWKWHFGRKHKG